MKVILVHDSHLTQVIHDLNKFRDSTTKVNNLIKRNKKRLEKHREKMDKILEEFMKSRAAIGKAYDDHYTEVVRKAKKAGVKHVLTEGRKEVVYDIMRRSLFASDDSMWKKNTLHQLTENIGTNRVTSLEEWEEMRTALAFLDNYEEGHERFIAARSPRDLFGGAFQYIKAAYQISKERKKADKSMAKKFIEYVKEGDKGPFLVHMGSDHVKGFRKVIEEKLPNIKVEEISAPKNVEKYLKEVEKQRVSMETLQQFAKIRVDRLEKKRKAKKPVRKGKMKKRTRDEWGF